MKKVEKIKRIMQATTLVDCYKLFTHHKEYLNIVIGFRKLERLESVIDIFELPEPEKRWSEGTWHLASWNLKIN